MAQKQVLRTKGASPAQQPPPQQQIITQQTQQQQHQLLTTQHLQDVIHELKDSMSSKLENMLESMSSRMENMSSKMENVSVKMESMEETMVSELEDIRHQIATQNEETRRDIVAAFAGFVDYVQNIEGEVEEVKQATMDLDQRTDRLEKENLMILYKQMEMALRIRGAVESSQPQDIRQICSAAFGALLQVDPGEIEDAIDRIYRVNSWYAKQKNLPRDIVVYFTRRSIRDRILQMSYQNKLQIAGQEVLVFKEIPPRMLRQRKEFKFLTDELKKRACQFRWDVPTGLVVDYSGVRHRLNTVEQAKEFSSKILGDGTWKSDRPNQVLAVEGATAKVEIVQEQRLTRATAKKRDQQEKQQAPPQQPVQIQQAKLPEDPRRRGMVDMKAILQRLRDGSSSAGT